MTGLPSAPIRVRWFVKGLGRGGAEQLLVAMAGAHAATGDVGVECVRILRAKSALDSALADAGCQVVSLDAVRTLDPRWVMGVFRSVRSARRDGIDVVHSHSPVVAAVVRLAARTLRRSRRPVVATTEHIEWQTLHRATRLMTRLTAPIDDVSIAVSQQVHDSMSARMRARNVVVTHGVDVAAIDRLTTARRAARAAGPASGVTGTGGMVLTVANLRRQKNYPNLVAAAARVLVARADVSFVAVGDGPERQAIEDVIADVGVADSFALLGSRDDVIDLLADADVFVLASDHEGLPVSVMEAAAAGVAMVLTDVGGSRAVLGDDGAWFVPPRDPGALADALLTALGDPEQCTQRSAVAAQRARDCFDVRLASALISGLYAGRVGGTGAG